MDIKLFDTEEFKNIRVVTENSEPLFAGKDICNYFGDSNHNRTLSRVDEEDKKVIEIIDTLGRKQNLIFVNESGLYSVLFAMQPQKANNGGGSNAYPIEIAERLEKIRKFKRWVTSEVLPTIRKTGGYTVPQTYADALRAYANEVEVKEQLLLENQTMKPKADFYDAVAESKTAIPMDQVAKVLEIKGVGRNKLFEVLREKRILQKNNIPYQKYIDRGYFRTVESKYSKPNGEVHVSIKTLVYQKGVEYIRKQVS